MRPQYSLPYMAYSIRIYGTAGFELEYSKLSRTCTAEYDKASDYMHSYCAYES